MDIKQIEKQITKLKADKDKVTAKFKDQIKKLDEKKAELQKAMSTETKAIDTKIVELNKAKANYEKLMAQANEAIKKAGTIISGKGADKVENNTGSNAN